MADKPTPNIDKLEALLTAIGGNPSVSYQARDSQSGFYTITADNSGARCAIGQGDTLADALRALMADRAKLNANTSVARFEKAAA